MCCGIRAKRAVSPSEAAFSEPMSRYLKRLLNLRAGEGGRVALLCLLVFAGHATQAVGKVLQLSVFLDRYGREAIPFAFLASAGSLALLSFGFAALTRVVERSRLAPATLGVLLAGFLAWRLLVAGRFAHAPFVLYVWVEVASVLAVVLAWNLVNDACDPRQGKRVLPLAALGASAAFLINGFAILPLVRAGLRPKDLSFFVVVALAGAIFLHQLLSRRLEEERHNREGPSTARARRGADRPAGRGRTGRATLWGSLRLGFSQLLSSRLLRLFAVVTALTILAQQLLDYMFLSGLRSHFGKAELASFLGVFMGALGAAQILLQLLVTGRLLSRLGGATCVLLSPLALAAGGFLFVAYPGFWLLAGLRFFDRVMKTSFYSPSLQALYTPVDRDKKIQAMALTKGLIAPLSKAVGAFGLISLARGLSLRWVGVGVASLSVVTLAYLAVRARKAYLGALEKALERRKLSLDTAVDEEFRLAADGAMLSLVREAVKKGPEANAVFALQFLGGVPLGQAREAILEALESPFARARAEAMALLEDGGPGEARRIAEHGLSDRDGTVVLKSLGGLARLEHRDAVGEVRELLSDDRAVVRAAAAVWLLRMASGQSEGAGMALAALKGHDDPNVRKTVPRVLRELGDSRFASECKVLLYDADPEVRGEALETAGELRLSELVDDVFLCLTSRGPRDAAASSLGKLGEPAVERLRELAWGGREAEMVVRRVPWILADIPTEDAGRLLAELLSHPNHEVRLRSARLLARRGSEVVEKARLTELLAGELEHGYRIKGLEEGFEEMGVGAPLLVGELAHRGTQELHQILALLGLEVGSDLVDVVRMNLESGMGRLRASAIELIDNVVDQSMSCAIIPLLEGVSETSLQRVDERFQRAYLEAKREPTRTALERGDPYVQAFVLHEVCDGASAPVVELSEEVKVVLPLIEKILFLKSAPIFAELSGDELHRIAEIADEISCDEGSLVVRQDDPGDAMYLVLHGEVSIRVAGKEMAVLGPKECFGEMALLDNLPRSADAVARVDTDLLRIDAESFDELLEQKHAIVKGIFRVLTGRLRKATARAGSREA